MIDRAKATADALDEMVAGVMGIKANKAVQLTPVGTETAKLPADLPGAFMATEGLADVAKDLRRQAQTLLDVADGIDVLLGEPAAVNAEHARQERVEQVLAEREQERMDRDYADAADGDKAAAKRIAEQEKFAAEFAAKQAAAQASAFKSADVDADDDDGWTCPTHGDEDIRNLTSGKGRKYRACGVPNCKEFERA